MNRLKVLLVDDEPDTGAALHGWLERRGYDSLYAAGPKEADRILGAGTFDVVLSDIQMPGNFRLEWIERCLQHECPPPILLMTGSPQLETAMRAANLPVAGYLLKPLDYDRAADLIERLALAQRHRVELRVVTREVIQLLASRKTQASDPLSQQLEELARRLTAATQRDPRLITSTSACEPWRDAVAETIVILEKTKHSFHSKELGELRRRLQRLVPVDAVLALKNQCHLTAG